MMKAKNIILFVALFLVVYAVVQLPISATEAKFPPDGQASIKIKKGSFIFVDDNKMNDESRDVASGSTIETTRTADAQIFVGAAGNLQLEKRTRVRLNYTARETLVILETGCATLWVEPGMKGSIKTHDDEKTIENDRSRDSIEICSDKRIGGILLWNTLIGASAAGGTTAAAVEAVMTAEARTEVIVPNPVVASASSLSNLENSR